MCLVPLGTLDYLSPSLRVHSLVSFLWLCLLYHPKPFHVQPLCPEVPGHIELYTLYRIEVESRLSRRSLWESDFRQYGWWWIRALKEDGVIGTLMVKQKEEGSMF